MDILVFFFSSCLFFPKTCMFVMSKVSVCLFLFMFSTETGIKMSKKTKQKKTELQKNLCNGSNADAEIKVPLLRTRNCESFPFKAGSRSEYSHACFTCCLRFLACPNFYLVGSFTYTFHSLLSTF